MQDKIILMYINNINRKWELGVFDATHKCYTYSYSVTQSMPPHEFRVQGLVMQVTQTLLSSFFGNESLMNS